MEFFYYSSINYRGRPKSCEYELKISFWWKRLNFKTIWFEKKQNRLISKRSVFAPYLYIVKTKTPEFEIENDLISGQKGNQVNFALYIRREKRKRTSFIFLIIILLLLYHTMGPTESTQPSDVFLLQLYIKKESLSSHYNYIIK